MKIVLVNPSQFKVYGRMRAPVQLHMGLAYLEAVLKKNSYHVDIIDIDAEGLSLRDFASRIKEDSVDIVGITVTTPTLSSSLELAGIVKDVSAKTKVVFGGIHPSVMPRETISYDNVDFVIKGEGELTLLELMQVLAGGRSLTAVDGLLFKDGKKIIENNQRGLIDNLDSLPFPARDLFIDSPYTYPDALHAFTTPMITSRGCPGQCTYCNTQSIFGRRFRARSAGNVADEVEFLTREHNIKEIHIWDDNFVTKKERVFKIRDEIDRRNIKVKFAFPNGIRADFLDEDVLEALKEMGTYSIAIGVESGNQEVLDKARKGIKIDEVIKSFALAKKFGLETWAFFMFGLPGEDIDAAYDTIRFAKRLDPDIAKFHILKPYPGTEVHRYMSDNNLLSSFDYDNYGIHTPPVHHLNDLTEEELLKLQRKAYREFYFRPIKLLRQVLRIKSYNRLRLNLKSALDITRMAFER